MKKLFFIFYLIIPFFIYSQYAYEGLLDYKMRIGLTFQEQGKGLQIILDRGLSDYFSTGLQFGYFLDDIKKNSVISNSPVMIDIDQNDDFLDRIDANVRLDLHYNYLLSLPDKLDIVTGLHLGRNIGAHIGVDYLLVNSFGIQGNVSIPIVKPLIPFEKEIFLYKGVYFGFGAFVTW
jgi:hypothetical protein